MNESGKLYIVATPIGNLQDITERAIETLKTVDFILAEDTRVTLKLLSHFNISKKLYSYHEHSSPEKNQTIVENLKSGTSYALVSDAGTPAVSDPGAKLVELARENDIDIIPIPGVSAITTILSIFGKPAPSFHFWGFFPTKLKKQKELLEYFENIQGIHIFFESPYRIEKIFEKHLLQLQNFHVVIGREMTKKFESFYVGPPKTAFAELKKDQIKGEFCIALLKNK